MPRFPLPALPAGRTFSGKSEQAARLADRFHLKILSANALLTAAVNKATDVKYGRLKCKAEDPDLRCGQAALHEMLAGGEVSDGVYCDLITAAIERLAKENENIEATHKAVADGDIPEDELPDNFPEFPFTGWILEDFPETAAQAELLEKGLSGYDPLRHVASRWDRASSLAQPLTKPTPAWGGMAPTDPSATVPSAIDLLVYLEADRDLTLQRALGRRVDPEGGDFYHLDTDPPPGDQICKERLVEPLDQTNPAANLSLQVSAHDVATEPLLGHLGASGAVAV